MALQFIASTLVLFLAQTASAYSPDRESLVSLRTDYYKDVRSYWDVGVDKDECAFLPPQTKKTAAQPWAPFDFYTNVVDKAEQDKHKAAGTLGEPDVFFDGDNNNRNASKDPHDWTRIVADQFKGSLTFLQKRVTKNEFEFLLSFKRGLIDYKTLILTRAEIRKGKCTVFTVNCTDTSEKGGKTVCNKGGWNRELVEVVAQADSGGFASDKLFGVTDEQKKNDVYAVFGKFQDLDENGEPKGDPYLLKVASKEKGFSEKAEAEKAKKTREAKPVSEDE